MNDFENAYNELGKTIAYLRKNKAEVWEKSQYFLSEWTKTLKQTTRAVKLTTNLTFSRTTCLEMLDEQKIVCGLIDSFFERHKKITNLENANREKTAQITQLIKDKLPTDGAVSDELDGYELDKHFYPLCENLKKSWENRFPRADSTQKEIDDFKEYLRLVFLRISSDKANELKNDLNELYGQFIEEYDKFVEAVYDPQRGGRLFGEYGLYLLDLNEDARQKLLERNDSYLSCVTLGGRPVKYYDDKQKFVLCNGEINYRHTEELDVLFPGFCARCKNSDHIWLLIPPYLYYRPIKPSEEPLTQNDALPVEGEKEVPGAEVTEEDEARLSSLSDDKSMQEEQSGNDPLEDNTGNDDLFYNQVGGNN